MRPSPSGAPEGWGSGVPTSPGCAFNVEIAENVVGRLGCPHRLWEMSVEQQRSSADACRSCSLMLETETLGESDHLLDFKATLNSITGARHVRGQAATPRARFWVSRLLAVAQGHPDPIVLMIRERRMDELGQFGLNMTNFPLWAVLEAVKPVTQS